MPRRRGKKKGRGKRKKNRFGVVHRKAVGVEEFFQRYDKVTREANSSRTMCVVGSKYLEKYRIPADKKKERTLLRTRPVLISSDREEGRLEGEMHRDSAETLRLEPEEDEGEYSLLGLLRRPHQYCRVRVASETSGQLALARWFPTEQWKFETEFAEFGESGMLSGMMKKSEELVPPDSRAMSRAMSRPPVVICDAASGKIIRPLRLAHDPFCSITGLCCLPGTSVVMSGDPSGNLFATNWRGGSEDDEGLTTDQTAEFRNPLRNICGIEPLRRPSGHVAVAGDRSRGVWIVDPMRQGVVRSIGDYKKCPGGSSLGSRFSSLCCADDTGLIWTGSAGGVEIWDSRSPKRIGWCSSVTTAEPKSLLYMSRHKLLVVVSEYGFHRIDPRRESKRFQTFECRQWMHRASNPGSVPYGMSSSVLDMAILGWDLFAAVTHDGLFVCDVSGRGKLVSYCKTESQNRCICVVRGAPGRFVHVSERFIRSDEQERWMEITSDTHAEAVITTPTEGVLMNTLNCWPSFLISL